MPRLIPETPSFITTSEHEVWERLRGSLGPDDVLMANVRLTDQDKDSEADLVVLMAELGILVLEVKGGSVWHDETGWWIKRGEGTDRCHPVDQARDAKYQLRRYVEADPRWGIRGHVAPTGRRRGGLEPSRARRRTARRGPARPGGGDRRAGHPELG